MCVPFKKAGPNISASGEMPFGQQKGIKTFVIYHKETATSKKYEIRNEGEDHRSETDFIYFQGFRQKKSSGIARSFFPKKNRIKFLTRSLPEGLSGL
jgi:hypothetical protein